MRIVAPKALRNRVILSLILGLIFASLAIGYRVLDRSAVETMIGKHAFYTVVIDAGHGGFDGGASAADGTLEKDINLKIALYVRDFLNAMGIQTVMTRTDDRGTNNDEAKTIREKKVSDLKNRLALLSESADRIFVSIHQNHFSETEYYGTQVFYSGNHPASVRLAEAIRAAVTNKLQPENTRELKQSGSEIYLLHRAEVPAVMVECGFLSNPEETEKLKTDAYQKKLALMIALGIIDYMKAEDGANGA